MAGGNLTIRLFTWTHKQASQDTSHFGETEPLVCSSWLHKRGS